MQLQIRPSARNAEAGKKIIAIDIETACDIEGCPGHCDHALDHNSSKITVLALYGMVNGVEYKKILRGNVIPQLQIILNEYNEYGLVFHNGKFDLKKLIHEGLDISLDRWAEDTSLLAFVLQEKVDDHWLDEYNKLRTELNKNRKHKHRQASYHSLKTLAPYFLNVQPFWEADEGFDNDEYVMKDTEYTYRLYGVLTELVEKQGKASHAFYKNKLLPWAKNLLLIELDGIAIDGAALNRMWGRDEARFQALQLEINEQWKHHFEAYIDLQRSQINEEYIQKSKEKSEKQLARLEISKQRALERVEPLNLASPMQLKWLLVERLGLDISDFNGDESTDRETLNRLAASNTEVGKLLEYRKIQKLLTSFYPEYDTASNQSGRIHSNFNITGARTGRLSSSSPNLQQVPGELHSIFIAAPGNCLITRDLSAIEPTVLAYYSEDTALCDIVINSRDFHGTNAVTMFDLDCEPNIVKKEYPKLRQIAKTVGLAILYGAGANRVLQTLVQAGITHYTQADCKALVNRLRNFYAGVWEFKLQLDRELESGQILYNFMDRPFAIQTASDVYMKGMNTLIQGSASDLMQQAALDIRNKGYTPRLIVHDELVVEVPKLEAEQAEKVIIDEMTKFKLKTKYGMIPIRTEGRVDRVWSK